MKKENFLVENYVPEELDNCMEFITGGRFVFGIKKEEKLRLADRFAVHPDMLHFHTDYREMETSDFWIDKYPVTRGQFLRFMRETGYKIPYNGWLLGWTQLTGWQDFQPSNYPLPMVGVNSQDAESYAKWLGKRLPTEVEWEKAWRGGDGRLFPSGEGWEEKFISRNPGGISLKVSLPVGSHKEIGPYRLNDFSLVCEWVKTVFPGKGKTGTYDENPYILAGGSFFNTQPYTFLPSNRFSWSSQMRIYNSGFRCVSDAPPKDLVTEPNYRVKRSDTPEILQIKKELYLKEKIRIVPSLWANVSIYVPWFPESLWSLDCPETDWDGFGGACGWPDKNEEKWKVDWKVNEDQTYAGYERISGGKRVFFEIYSEKDKVFYKIKTKNLQFNLNTFCLKTFSPFFSSQERLTQNIWKDSISTSLVQRPLPVHSGDSDWNIDHLSFHWKTGKLKKDERFCYLSYDKKSIITFPQGNFSFSGNGWVPCTHIHSGGKVDKAEGFYSFSLL